jgi:hypothetical protein
MSRPVYDLSGLNLTPDEIEIINSGDEVPSSLISDSGFVTSDCEVEFDGKSLVVKYPVDIEGA